MDEPLYFFSRSMPYWGLSNASPPGFEAEGLYWPTVEHYYQAHKFADPTVHAVFAHLRNASQARTLGQTRAYTLRADWQAVREQIMLTALRLKFHVPAAQRLLMSTGAHELIATLPRDSYWGAGADGKGQNRLGRLLEQVRDELACEALDNAELISLARRRPHSKSA